MAWQTQHGRKRTKWNKFIACGTEGCHSWIYAYKLADQPCCAKCHAPWPGTPKLGAADAGAVGAKCSAAAALLAQWHNKEKDVGKIYELAGDAKPELLELLHKMVGPPPTAMVGKDKGKDKSDDKKAHDKQFQRLSAKIRTLESQVSAQTLKVYRCQVQLEEARTSAKSSMA